jgi:hypothetical protein
MNTLLRKSLITFIALILAVFITLPASAGGKPPPVSPLATKLQTLVTQGTALKTQLTGITLTADNLCSQLSSAHKAAKAYIDGIATVNGGLAAPLHLDTDVMNALDQLGYINRDLGTQDVRLSGNLSGLPSTTPMYTISDGLVAMLQLSDDIGTMADRILEMADKILVMADNIGLMADRIVTTEQLQSANLALTESSILTTQQNALALVKVVDTGTFNLNLQTLLNDGNALVTRMRTVILSPSNMATQLKSTATDVKAYLDRVTAMQTTINTSTATNTLYINADSLTALANMSVMVSSLGTALQGYSVAENSLAAITTKLTLTDALRSTLQLSADIGTMADSILEMADVILAMSDNIGLEADQILLTQQLQSTNLAATEGSILSTQTVVIGLFATFSL